MFKDISYLELWLPFVWWSKKMCNFGRRHHEEHFPEINLNLDKWFRRRCRLIFFLSRALSALMFS